MRADPEVVRSVGCGGKSCSGALGLRLGGELDFLTDSDIKRRLWQNGSTIDWPSVLSEGHPSSRRAR